MSNLIVPKPASVTEAMRMIPAQARYFLSRTRFNVVPAGRRSGKTAIAKRRLAKKARLWHGLVGARFIASAPVQHQAKRIYWPDLKRLIPAEERIKTSEGDLTMELINGSIIQVMGMDRPERAEGSPIAHFLFDEYGNCHEDAWTENIRPAMSELAEATADFIGVPEGRNHYWKLWTKALLDGSGEWQGHTWKTAEVLPIYLGDIKAAHEIATAKEDMDELTYRQEYEADFNNFDGKAYYSFNRQTHAIERLAYDKDQPLIICLDFNVAPGVAVYCQEQFYYGEDSNIPRDETITMALKEVWIPKASNTPTVCRKIIDDLHPDKGRWRQHQGDIYLYGDATGAIKKTQSVSGSDWDIIKDYLRPVFGDRLKFRNKRQNPEERVRVNSMNTRFMTASGKKRFLVDPVNCPHLIEDLESVSTKEGTNGEIDKDINDELTHISDALGYYVEAKHPIRSRSLTAEVVY